MKNTPIFRQGGAYALVGLLQLGLDWMCFVVLTYFGMAIVPANIAGRILGAACGFWLNAVVTFKGQVDGRPRFKQLSRFLVSWGVMTALSSLGVSFIDRQAGIYWAWLLKPALDIGLAALGFLTSKYWIYKR